MPSSPCTTTLRGPPVITLVYKISVEQEHTEDDVAKTIAVYLSQIKRALSVTLFVCAPHTTSEGAWRIEPLQSPTPEDRKHLFRLSTVCYPFTQASRTVLDLKIVVPGCDSLPQDCFRDFRGDQFILFLGSASASRKLAVGTDKLITLEWLLFKLLNWCTSTKNVVSQWYVSKTKQIF